MSHAEQLESSIDRLIAAFQERDPAAYENAGRELVEVARQARPSELDAVVGRLLPVVAEIHVSGGAGLVQVVGSMVGTTGTSAPAVVPVLVERACEVMEQALAFVASYREIFGAEPERDDETVAERYLQAAGARGVERPDRYAASWEVGESWLQPVLFLCQRTDVRRALPGRERLRSLVEQVEDLFPDVAPWLLGLLRVLDDETLIVVHRESGQVFRATMTGVADNFQLHTLLAARLLGAAPRRGLFSRRRAGGYLSGEGPTAAMVAAADGSGDMAPAGGVVGQFNLADAHGAWIWNEGRPDEIPVVQGHRVVVLDPPPYQRSWNTGRVYPLITATLDIEPVPEREAADWRTVIKPAGEPPTTPGRTDNLSEPVSPGGTDNLSASVSPGGTDDLAVPLPPGRTDDVSETPGRTDDLPAPPPGWTDDLAVPLPPGRTVADVVDLVFALADRGMTVDEVDSALARELGLSAENAALARDRAFGGLVRAATNNQANEPSPVKDPIAHESYRRALADPALIRKYYPDLGGQ